MAPRKNIFSRIADIFRSKRATPIDPPLPLSEAWKGIQGDDSPEEDLGLARLLQTEDEFTRYMLGEWIVVTSSNVEQIRFLADPGELRALMNRKGKQRKGLDFGRGDRFQLNGRLHIRFKDHSVYEYVGIPPDLAEDFYTVASKGTFVWDVLRVRGTVTGHRFEYHYIESMSQTQRKWNRSQQSAIDWGKSGDATNARLGIKLGAKRARRKSPFKK